MLVLMEALGYIFLGIILGWLARNVHYWIEWKLSKRAER